MDTVLMDIESMERGKLSPLLKLILKLKLTPGTAIMAMDMATMDTVLMDIESMERGKLSPLLKLKLKLTPGTAIMATMDTMVTTVPMDTMDIEESMDKLDRTSRQIPEYDSPWTKAIVSIVQYLGLSNRKK